MINLKYKIVEVNPNGHSIVVRFYTDVITEAMLAIDTQGSVIRRCRTDYSFDLPIPAPLGSDLDTFIVARAPIGWLETQEVILNPNVDTSLSAVLALLNVEVTIQTQSPVETIPTAIPVTTI